MAEPEAPAAPSGIASIADPAPLGLAAFALTTFLLSASNAGLTRGTGAAWLGYALAYGGLGQLLAGMWEFRRGNVFGATAFSTYGGFWIGLFLYQVFVKSNNATNDLGWILLAFAIFNLYMLMWSTQDPSGYCVYPDSEKILYWAEGTSSQRRKIGPALDYYVDEPL